MKKKIKKAKKPTEVQKLRNTVSIFEASEKQRKSEEARHERSGFVNKIERLEKEVEWEKRRNEGQVPPVHVLLDMQDKHMSHLINIIRWQVNPQTAVRSKEESVALCVNCKRQLVARNPNQCEACGWKQPFMGGGGSVFNA